MMRPILTFFAALALLPCTAMAVDSAAASKTRLTVGIPAYVTHPDDRSATQDWNEGWLNNEGIMADVSWPQWNVDDTTNVRLGVTGGAFDNSIDKTSVFLGGMVELEKFVGPRLALSVGTYAGGITGYDYDVSPAIAPYVGASYAVTDKIEVGARGFWLPSKTLAGSNISPSDAYVGVITVGTRF